MHASQVETSRLFFTQEQQYVHRDAMEATTETVVPSPYGFREEMSGLEDEYCDWVLMERNGWSGGTSLEDG